MAGVIFAPTKLAQLRWELCQIVNDLFWPHVAMVGLASGRVALGVARCLLREDFEPTRVGLLFW